MCAYVAPRRKFFEQGRRRWPIKSASVAATRTRTGNANAGMVLLV